MENNSIKSLQVIYEGLWLDPVAQFFLLIIIGWLGLGLILLRLPSPRARKFVMVTPSALTTLGILGTFIGILLGLAQFDVNAIDKSVPALLDGMKLAFATSITGISSSLLFKGVAAFFGQVGGHDSQVTPSDILAALNSINEKASQAAEDNKNSMLELRNAISSDKDSSLITQVQKLRTTVSDGQEELIKEFKEFASHMAENNQKAIIEALEAVIRDFNEKLTEQFGENFKQLNLAVEKLVEWQEEYRKHLEVYDERLKSAVVALECSEEALSSVKDATDKIPAAVELLDPTTRMLIKQLEILEESLKSIHSLREKTDGAFPTIEGNLERITSNFSENVTGLLDKSNKAVEQSGKSFETISSGYESILEGAKTTQEKFGLAVEETVSQMSEAAEKQFTEHGEMIEETASRIAEAAEHQFTSAKTTQEKFGLAVEETISQMSEAAEKQFAKHGEMIETTTSKVADMAEKQFTKHGQLIENSAAQSDKAIQEAWVESAKKINSQFEQFDNEMQKELSRAMEQLGKSLASISEKFVSDYTPLTQKLQKLVETARNTD